MPISRLAPLALVALVATLAAGASAQNVPDWPDLMLKTRVTHQGATNSVYTNVIYLKGQRARREMESNGRPPIPQFLDITQCDEHRTLILNPEAKAYAYRPIVPVRHDLRIALGSGLLRNGPPPDPNAAIVTVTNDAVDTGERRQFSHYTARHVITTYKTEPHAGAHTQASGTHIDGWYLDLPDASCTDPADQVYGSGTFVGSARVGGSPDRFELKQLGTARRGFPIEETSTHTEGPPRSVRLETRCELIELSEAPLDDALFTVPPDYLPALPMPNGGFDLRRQDTLFNRLALYYQNAVAWWDYLTTGRPSYGHGY